MVWQGFGVGGGGGWLVSCGILQGALEGGNDVEATPRALQGPGVSTGNLRTPTASDPRRMYSSQWGVLISIDVGSLYPLTVVPPIPSELLNQTSCRGERRRPLHPTLLMFWCCTCPPSALKGRRCPVLSRTGDGATQADSPDGNACDPCGAYLW